MHGQVPDPQGRPPQPPYPPMGPPGGPPPAKKKRPVLLLAAIGLVAVVGVAGVAIVAFQVAGNRLSGPLAAEQCVDVAFEMKRNNRVPTASRVHCDDETAEGKVLKVAGEESATNLRFARQSQPECPAGTDGWANVKIAPEGETMYQACVRNIEGPNPGDPGAGGGLLAAGDCVTGGSFGGGGQEKPCSEDDWYGKVVARVDTEQSCPAETLETMTLRSLGGGDLTHPVLCLGPGGGVVAKDDCIADPSFQVRGLRKVDCGSSRAIAQVLDRVKTQQECPGAATNYLTSDGAYLPVLCVKQLRPTLSQKLRSLNN